MSDPDTVKKLISFSLIERWPSKIIIWALQIMIFLFFTRYYYYLFEQTLTAPGIFTDFKIFYSSVHEYLTGGSLYSHKATNLPFEHPNFTNRMSPPGALLLLPLGLLSYQIASGLWVIVQFLLLALILRLIWLVFHEYFPEQPTLRITLLLFVYISLPVVYCILNGNFGMPVALLVVLAWYCSRNQKLKLAGVGLGLSVAIRWQPILLLLFLLLPGVPHGKKILGWSIFTVIASFCAGLAVFGFQAYLAFGSIVLEGIGQGNSFVTDGSLSAFWERIFNLSDLQASYKRTLGNIFTLLSSLILVALSLWRYRKLDFDHGFSLFLVCGLLVTPSTWVFYHVVLLLPVTLMWIDRRIWSLLFVAIFWVDASILVILNVMPYPTLFGSLVTISLLIIYHSLFRTSKESRSAAK